MKRTTREWVRKAENDFKAATQLLRRRKEIVADAVCFLCQQCLEYLKARLTEAGVAFPRTHDLLQLLNLCVPLEPPWAAYGKVVDAMTDYAVDYRYPGSSSTVREAKSTIKHCRSIRSEVRRRLGLKPWPSA